MTVAHSRLVVMRRGNLSGAEAITGRRQKTIGRWLRAAAAQAALVTSTLVHDRHVTVVEIGDLWDWEEF